MMGVAPLFKFGVAYDFYALKRAKLLVSILQVPFEGVYMH
jgi:hypothetical protein